MTTPPPAEETDEAEARTVWLLRQSPDQIAHYSFETILDWLLARNAQRRARLTAACQSLRADTEARAAAHDRLARAITAAARTAT
jgi:hypothetical protein